jgi:hypothetical protein
VCGADKKVRGRKLTLAAAVVVKYGLFKHTHADIQNESGRKTNAIRFDGDRKQKGKNESN